MKVGIVSLLHCFFFFFPLQLDKLPHTPEEIRNFTHSIRSLLLKTNVVIFEKRHDGKGKNNKKNIVKQITFFKMHHPHSRRDKISYRNAF